MEQIGNRLIGFSRIIWLKPKFVAAPILQLKLEAIQKTSITEYLERYKEGAE